jgi:hypothetical protein
MRVVALPLKPGQSVADQLREIAAQIDAGEYGGVLSVAWVADCGGGTIEVGFCGQSPLEGAHAHLLLAMGMRKLEG